MAIVNYFEKSYLGLSNPSDTRTGDKYGIEHWNHHATVLVDPEYPRTSNRNRPDIRYDPARPDYPAYFGRSGPIRYPAK